MAEWKSAEVTLDFFFFSLLKDSIECRLAAFQIERDPDASDGQWHRTGYHTFNCKLHSANHILPFKQPIRHFQS